MQSDEVVQGVPLTNFSPNYPLANGLVGDRDHFAECLYLVDYRQSVRVACRRVAAKDVVGSALAGCRVRLLRCR